MNTNIGSPNESAVEVIERFADCILNDSKDQNNENDLQKLASHILYFCQAAELNKARENIFEEFAQMIDSSSEKLDENIILKNFSDQIIAVKSPFSDPQKCDKYQEFLKKISQSKSDEDEEIRTVSETVNLVDPLSKLPIVDPIKNKVCGHVYEKKTILQFISKNPRTKCPIAGCNAVDYVKKSDLVEDSSLKRMIQNTK